MKKNLNYLVLMVTFLVLSAGANAQNSKYQVAFLYNFTNYIEWPADYKTGNFIIGVLGQNTPIAQDLKELAKMKKVHGQTIEVRVFARESDVSNCHILYVPKNFANKIAAIENSIKGSTLLISDTPGSISKGAAISFVESNGKLGYELQASNAEKHGLKLNSRLAALAVNK